MMLPFRIKCVEPLIAHADCNSQHAWAITSVLLLNYSAYPTCFDRPVYSQCALRNKTWARKAFCLFYQ